MDIGTNTDAQRPVVQKLPDPKPRMTTTGAETLPQQASPATQEATRLARELAADIGKTKAELKKTKAELAKAKQQQDLAYIDRQTFEQESAFQSGLVRKEMDIKLKETSEQLTQANEELERMKARPPPPVWGDQVEMAMSDRTIPEDTVQDKAIAELRRTKNQLTEAEAGRRNAQNKGFLDLELEKQAREAERKESSQILTRTKEELERMKMSSQDVKALPAKPINLAQLKSLASMKAETDKFMEISRQARFSMDREYRASQASRDSRDSLDFSNIQQINERQLFEIRQRRTMEPVSQRNLLNVDALSSLPKSRLSTLVEQNIAREDELQRMAEQFRTRESADSEESAVEAPLKGIKKPIRPSVRKPLPKVRI
jgi:hypothetical protein